MANMETNYKEEPMTRIMIQLDATLLRQLDQTKPPAQSRSEWIREAIRQRLRIEHDLAYATQSKGDTPS